MIELDVDEMKRMTPPPLTMEKSISELRAALRFTTQRLDSMANYFEDVLGRPIPETPIRMTGEGTR